MPNDIDGIADELRETRETRENYEYNISLNDDVAVTNRIALIDKGSIVSAIIAFSVSVAAYFTLIFFGISGFNAAVISILAILAVILYSIDTGSSATHELLLFLRADSREHYKALHNYQELQISIKRNADKNT